MKSPSDEPLNTPDALVTRDGPIMTLTFNRPQTRNAMTWAMYERLLQVCEEVDADDSVRVPVHSRVGHGYPFLIAVAASLTAVTILSYPVHRQRLPASQ